MPHPLPGFQPNSYSLPANPALIASFSEFITVLMATNPRLVEDLKSGGVCGIRVNSGLVIHFPFEVNL